MRSVLGTVLFLCAVSANASSSFTVGYERSTGKYGNTEETSINAIPLSLKLSSGLYTFSASVPYVEVQGPLGVFAGTNTKTGSPTASRTAAQPQAETNRRFLGFPRNSNSTGGGASEAAIGGALEKVSGLGDLTLGLTRSLAQNKVDGVYLDGTVKVKLPTGDEQQGLSTGKADISVQVDAYKLTRGVSYFGTLGFKKVGQSDFVELQNSAFGSMGFSQTLRNKDSVGMSFDFRQAIAKGNDDSKEITVFYSTEKLMRGTRTQFYVTKGMGDNSPELAIGVAHTLKLSK